MGGGKNPYWSSLFNEEDIEEYEFNSKSKLTLSWLQKCYHGT